jgi:uncharacterized protein
MVHLARLLASFHASAERSDLITQAATPEAIRARWDASLEEMARFVPAILEHERLARVADFARRYVLGREALYRRRIDLGRVVDGHGDLLAEDIFFLPDGPRVIDCLEFDDRLRHGDVVADLAFLAMDLERLGDEALALHFLAAYREHTGDSWPRSLAHHYIAERALVRSKVTCIRVDQGDPAAGSDARRLFGLAEQHLDACRVRLVLIGGLPGTGKTTLANLLADSTEGIVLHSDEVRRDVAGIEHDAPAEAPYRTGLYTADRTAETYDALLERARVALELGETVVLDASWLDATRRRAAAALARQTASDLVQLRCVTDTPIASRRIEARRAHGTGPHDATVEISAAMAANADPWPEAITIDTTETLAASVARARRALACEQ